MTNRKVKNGSSDRFSLLGLQILLMVTAAMQLKEVCFLEGLTNPDSLLKSKGITLPTKVCLVKALNFPVVMYECESCTIEKGMM